MNFGNKISDEEGNIKLPSFSMSGKAKKILVALVIILVVIPMTMGVNIGGERTVIQKPWGTMSVKFSPGPYFNFFGPTWEYSDVATFDFSPEIGKGDALIDTAGIPVRYLDGGTGSIFGSARFPLPNDEATMLKLHKEFKSQESLAYKLLKPVTEETMNLTAGLMTSGEAYAEKRGVFIEQSRDQLSSGKYRTILKGKEVEDEAGEKTWKQVPVIALDKDNITPLRIGDSDLGRFGISVSGFQIINWGFEESTLQQISDKRDATMAIITAKANAERAKQDKITAREEGLKNVEVAKYAKEVIKQEAVTDAEKDKEVAVIAAQQTVDVAAQGALEAEQKRLIAEKYKAEQILRGEGDSERRRLVMEADGALAQRLETYEKVNLAYAAAMANHRLVPSIVMGGSSGSEGSGSAQALIDMFAAKTAADLQVRITEPQTMQSVPMNQQTQ